MKSFKKSAIIYVESEKGKNKFLLKLNLIGATRLTVEKEENVMTKREFYNAIANGQMTDELMDYATEQIARMDSANEKRKNTLSKKQEENEAVKAEMLKHLNTEPMTATTVGELMGISTQKASALLRQLVNDSKATATEVKIPKKGTQKGYVRNFAE